MLRSWKARIVFTQVLVNPSISTEAPEITCAAYDALVGLRAVHPGRQISSSPTERRDRRIRVRISPIVKFRTGIDSPLKTVGKVIRIQQKAHKLGQPINFGVIVVDKSVSRFLGSLGICKRECER